MPVQGQVVLKNKQAIHGLWCSAYSILGNCLGGEMSAGIL